MPKVSPNLPVACAMAAARWPRPSMLTQAPLTSGRLLPSDAAVSNRGGGPVNRVGQRRQGAASYEAESRSAKLQRRISRRRAARPMSSFFSPYRHQFVRVGACVPQVAVAEPAKNGDQALALLRDGDAAGIALMVFPELSLSAYSIDDLLFQDAVLDAVEAQIDRLAAASEKLLPAFVVGAPLRREGRLYNCAVAIHRGRVLGVVPKIFLPNYREFYERRHFTSGEGVRGGSIAVAGREAPFGSDLIFAAEGPTPFTFHIEICEDLWVPTPPSAAGRRRRGGNPAEPFGEQYRDRQGADAAAAVRVAIGALHRGLRLFRGRGRRVDDRPRLGRTGRHLRDRRAAVRDPALQRRPRDRGRRCRCRPHPPGAHANQHVRRQRAADRPERAAVPPRRIRFRAARRPARAAAAGSSGFRSCRPIRRCCATIATRHTTSRCRGWRSG